MMNFKSKSRVCLLILFIFIISIGESQTYFKKNFDFFYYPWVPDGGLNVVETDSGYVANGATGDPIYTAWNRLGMVKMDEQGEILIRKSWGDTTSRWYTTKNGLIKDSNNFYSVGSRNTYYPEGNHSEMLMVKYNQNLDTLWTAFYGKKQYPYDTSYIPRGFIKTNNGFMLVGTTFPDYGEDSFAMLLKVDSLGQVIWETQYGDQDYYYMGKMVVNTSDGGFAIGGYRFNFKHGTSIGDPILIKTDSIGKQEWMIAFAGPYQDGAAVVCKSDDGNILVAARYDVDSLFYDHYLSRIRYVVLDNGGNIHLDTLYGDIEDILWVNNIKTVENDGVVISGSVWNSYPSFAGYMFRIDENNDSLWYRRYTIFDENSSQNYLWDAIPVADGGYIGIGTCMSISQDEGSQDAWVVKVDSLGCESEWDCWVGEQEWKAPEKTEASIRIYPNPAGDKFKVQSRAFETGDCRLEIVDLLGRKTKELHVPKRESEVEVSTGGWEKGLYVVKVIVKDGTGTSGKVLLK